MKTPEEYLRINKSQYDSIADIVEEMSTDEIIERIEQAQKDAYNQAINDVNSLIEEHEEVIHKGIVNDILELKK